MHFEFIADPTIEVDSCGDYQTVDIVITSETLNVRLQLSEQAARQLLGQLTAAVPKELKDCPAAPDNQPPSGWLQSPLVAKDHPSIIRDRDAVLRAVVAATRQGGRLLLSRPGDHGAVFGEALYSVSVLEELQDEGRACQSKAHVEGGWAFRWWCVRAEDMEL